MNTVYAALASLAIMACLAGWGSWESGKVDKLQGQMDSLKAAYSTAAEKARNDAQIQEAKDLAALKSNSSQAISQAQSGQQQAQNQLKVYQAKLAAAATEKDLGHRCAGVQIPGDLIP